MAKRNQNQRPAQQAGKPARNTKRRGGKMRGGNGAPRGRDENFKDDDRLTDTGGLSRADLDARARSSNDWQWYAQTPELLKAYASFPFGTAVGAQIPNMCGTPDPVSIPGIAAYYYYPTVGRSTEENAPINIAMRKLYSFVRHQNSGHSNYDAPDLFLYVLAMDSVMMYHAFLKRLYGCLMNFTPWNRYYSKAVITAMGCDYDDLQKHIPDLFGFINLLAAKAGAMKVPASFTYMMKHTWMTSNVYVDSNTLKAQTYLYVPAAYLQVQPITEQNPATSLKSTNFIQGGIYQIETIYPNTNRPLKTFDDLVTFGNSLLNPIVANEDFNIMSGDIMKAYGDNTVSLITMPQDYKVLPVYNPEVQAQIENCTVLGASQTVTITQATGVGTGYLVNQSPVGIAFPSLNYNSSLITTIPAKDDYNAFVSMICAPRVMNYHVTDVPPELVMVATRETIVPKANDYSSVSMASFTSDLARSVVMYFNTDVGSELIAGCAIFDYVNSATWSLRSRPFATYMPIQVTDPAVTTHTQLSALQRFNAMVTSIASFDWHPFYYSPVVAITASSKSPVVNAFATCDLANGDFDTYAFINSDELSRLHEAALLSEFWG